MAKAKVKVVKGYDMTSEQFDDVANALLEAGYEPDGLYEVLDAQGRNVELTSLNTRFENVYVARIMAIMHNPKQLQARLLKRATATGKSGVLKL